MKQIAAKFAVLVCSIGMAVQAAGGEFFVTPQGKAQGNGSRLLPWDIKTAVADNTKTQNVNNVVRPGDTIWLRGGTYGTGSNWGATSYLTGESNKPIVLRQYSGERAVINGGIRANGAWTTFWGFEIMNSATNRTSTSYDRQPGLYLLGVGHKAINMVIHDVGQPAIGFWSVVGNGGEVYGCILWNNGLYSTDPGTPSIRGDGIYAQNQYGSRYISDVIAFKNFTIGIKAYAENGYVNGFDLEGNVVFGNNSAGIHVSCTHNAIDSLIISSNYYFNNFESYLGDTYPLLDPSTGTNNQYLLFANNYQVQQAMGTYQYINSMEYWSYLTMTNNQFSEITTNAVYAQSAVFWEIKPTNVVSCVIDYNEYFGKNFTTNYNNWRPNNARASFSQVRALGYEAHGAFTLTAPTQNVVVLRANKYEPGRANLIVYNWQKNTSINVDISSIGLVQGEAFQLRDVQDYLGVPALSATYDAANPIISVPLTLTNCSKFIGDQHHYLRDPNLHTDPVFNAFVILPLITQGPSTLPPPSDLHTVPRL